MLGLILVFIMQPSWSDTVSTVATGFRGSGDLLVAADGDIFVANYGFRSNSADGSTIVRITPDGQVSEFASGFQGASGMALDGAGNIIQANISGNFISRVSPSGAVTTIASQGFSSPVGVAVRPDGQIFVANCGNNSISRIDNGAGVTFSTSSLFQCPNGLAADDENNLYAVNYNNGSVIKIDPQGNASQVADSGGGNGHIVFGNDRLYFANHALNQVFEMTRDGVLKVLAGSGVMGHEDGQALEATFSALNGIGISPDGQTIYVNEPVAIGPPFSVILNPNILRAIKLEQPNDFEINHGLAGSWYSPATSGQGFLFDFVVADERFDLLLYWFTYNDSAIDLVTERSGFGSSQSRWFTALGVVDGSEVIGMPIARTAGGLFDQASEVVTDAVGTIDIEFFSCTEAILNYTFFEPETRSGTITLQKLIPDIDCESLVSD